MLICVFLCHACLWLMYTLSEPITHVFNPLSMQALFFGPCVNFDCQQDFCIFSFSYKIIWKYYYASLAHNIHVPMPVPMLACAQVCVS